MTPTGTCRQIYVETRLLTFKYSTYYVSALELQWFARFMKDIDKTKRAIIWAALSTTQREFLGSAAGVRSVISELVEEGYLRCDALLLS